MNQCVFKYSFLHKNKHGNWQKVKRVVVQETRRVDKRKNEQEVLRHDIEVN